jgi:hypothetical protein
MVARTVPGGLGIKAFWDLGFNGWKDDMDANLRVLSALAGMIALGLVNADPGAPADGDVYLLSATHPTHPGTVAIRDNGAWVYITVPHGRIMFDVGTSQHRFFDGADWAVLAVAGGGGGVIGGVTLDGATNNIGIASLAATDSPYIAVSFWIRYHDATAVRNAISYANDVEDNYGIWHGNWNGGANDGKLASVFMDEVSFAYDRVIGPAVTASGAWIHYLIVFKGVDDGTEDNQIVVYENRVKLALTYNNHPAGDLTPTLNGKSFYVGSDSYNSAAAFDMAEFWLQTGHDFLEADGTITGANLDKFIDATLKPVPLGADGSTPTGTAPVIFCHRDAGDAAATFATNLGTGGALTLEGVLTDPVDNPGD